MRRLNDENFEHHHRIKWRAPALRPVRIGERCVQFRAKRLEFYRSLECLELVTEIAQPLQSTNDIEKSCLPSHRIISDPSATMESEMRRIGEVLRSIQLHGAQSSRHPRSRSSLAQASSEISSPDATRTGTRKRRTTSALRRS